jgi:DMSO/TMAO reductase YedYZ molybdopterin-dependent catalytic subunit
VRLTVVGVVDKPVTLTYDQLIEGFTPHSVVTALACAGNRRAELCGIGRVDVSLDEGRLGVKPICNP